MLFTGCGITGPSTRTPKCVRALRALLSCTPVKSDVRSQMNGWTLLTPRQVLLAVAYSAIFPVTNLVGGTVSMLGILVTLPFLGLAWVGGMTVVSVIGREDAYLVGASLTVFVQVLLILLVRNALRRRKNADAAT